MMGGRRVARRTARRTSRRQMAMCRTPVADTTSRHPLPRLPLLLLRPQPDYAEELQKLAELKAAGIINDEEFEAKKKQILGL